MKVVKLIVTLVLMGLSLNSYALSEPQKQLKSMLAEYKGQVIYLDFWASWCVPCRKSFPWMNEMQEKYDKQGFKVITINLDVNKKDAIEFLEENSANFTVIYDPKGSIAKEFKLKGMPNSFMIGRDGKPKSAHVGFFDDKKPEYEEEIKSLLKLPN
ncbi:TlpA disulfide reductase family protein [Thalassotalea crassostreae]|uniref:TlpA disulfide reductase family protein n=1 Tax=Thalassotalea crassostreae TaxID=1763536 RepID=UPI0008386C89|nr:TlpA disulfide reductase family protein [Thalassotalea crassostreae]